MPIEMERFISEASFWKPEYISPSAWVKHAPFAFWLMDVHRPGTLVELGTHTGYSFLAFNQALKRIGTKSRLFAIDTWEGDEHSGFYGNEVFEALSNYNSQNYGDFSELIRTTFDEAVLLFKDGTIDLLHIDGRHFYEDVKHDFETWKPKLSGRGVVLLHDTNVRARDFGVYRLWEELRQQYPHFEFLQGYGLGVIGVGTELPDLLKTLFAAETNEQLTHGIRYAYDRLGEVLQDQIVSKDTASALQLETERLEHERKTIELELAAQQQHSQALEHGHRQLQHIHSGLERRYRELESQLQHLQHEHAVLKHRHTEVEHKRDDLEHRHRQLQHDHRELESKQTIAEHAAQETKTKGRQVLIELEKSKEYLRQSSDAHQRLESELARRSAELAGVTCSASWRATAPLRWLSGRARSAKHSFNSLFRLFRWIISFQLRERLKLRAEKRLILQSGLFDANYYLEGNAESAQAKVDPVEHYLRSGTGNPNPVFDHDWYLANNQALPGTNPLLNYLTSGWKQRRNPGPLFDIAFYLGQNAELASAGIEPLNHYLRVGGFEGRDPNPLFDSDWYRARNPDIAANGENPLLHYLTRGWREGRDPHPLFDTAFYLQTNSDVVQAGTNPLAHYLAFGALERRNPNPLFDSDWYLAQETDVIRAAENPLLQYINYGWKEGRNPHPLVDTKYYLENNSDLAHAGVDPLTHYLYFGALEGRDPGPFFHSEWYLQRYPDVAQAVINPLIHYLREGWKQGRDPGPDFSTAAYLEQNPDIAASGLNPLIHYVCHGAEEGRPVQPARSTPSPARAFHAGKPRIVFVSGEEQTAGHRYRVANIAGSLAPRFFDVAVIPSAELSKRLGEVDGADVVWIWRARWSNETAALVSRSRSCGAKIIFDVDDLMFRPELASIELIDGIRSQNIALADVQSFYGQVRHLLLQADQCTMPTVSLAREAKALHKPATVIPNGFDRSTLENSRAAARQRRAKPDDGIIRIGYAAGTKTHQRDLGVASRALAAALTAYSSARLVLFRGSINLDEFPELSKLENQIEWRDPVALGDLPYEYANFDINIAPLEVGNPYCESKSELKFFEAALAGVPTVASPTVPFAQAIRHGVTGFLATGDDNWFNCLVSLIENRELRERLAKQAYQEVLWTYGPERRSLLTTRLVNRLLAPPALSSDLFMLETRQDEAAPPLQIPVADHDVLFQSERGGDSRVSVVVPLFNYGNFLPEALESVRLQTVRDIDLIVVDDRSTDDSAAVARDWLKSHASDFNMVALLQNRRNSKLGRTRNTGVAFADTEFFLPLDPDNALLPDCLQQCIAMLDETGAAFAYPTIEVFGEDAGRMGYVEYDPALFTCGNYIDAMAMVKKSCWTAVGGYSPLEPVGWEDYDFWCKLTEKGLFGARVQKVTARYRRHGQSMLRTVTELPENKLLVLQDLNTRHPWLELVAGEKRGGGSVPD